MSYEAELTSADVKAAAKRFGADLCGIGNMERWEGAPKQNDPRYIFPGAKSFIVFGFRIPRGSLRGIEVYVVTEKCTRKIIDILNTDT